MPIVMETRALCKSTKRNVHRTKAHKGKGHKEHKAQKVQEDRRAGLPYHSAYPREDRTEYAVGIGGPPPSGFSYPQQPTAATMASVPIMDQHPRDFPKTQPYPIGPDPPSNINGPTGPPGSSAALGTQAEGPLGTGLDPMSVVLTGMAQLQSVVQEMASPKANTKPETIKPGVVNLPELPVHGPESCLAFADWLHLSKPALADISDTSEDLWCKTVEEAHTWYSAYLKLDPLARLTATPKPSDELLQTKWARVARRIETMIVAACPQSIKDELNASRTSGLLPLLCRLFVIYGPGSLGT